jgi:hypothetical protein
MNTHTIWMIIGCTLPLLLIFLAPALGWGSDVSLFLFVLAMFACHLLMPMHRHRAGTTKSTDQPSKKTAKTERHVHEH